MPTPFDFDWRPRTPSAPLARFVEMVWYARGTVPYSREKIAPTGSSVAVFVLGDPILQTPDNGQGETLRAERGFLIGPHNRPVINEPTGETFAVGIVGTPIGCEAIFGVRPSHLRAKSVDLETAWPAARELRAALLATDDPEAMLDLVEGHLRVHHDAGIAGLDRCERAVALLEEEPTRPIAEIAAELGVSHGHLDREFTRVVGLSPRALSRQMRLRQLMAEIDLRSDVDWADLALGLGWFDQAHLIRDFKRHTGVTPSKYVAAQRENYPAEQIDNATGFVPES